MARGGSQSDCGRVILLSTRGDFSLGWQHIREVFMRSLFSISGCGLALALGLASFALPAQAFCGFYVSRADGALYNEASKVIYTHVNDTSVITMSSDYRGAAADFAMVVPTPAVLERSQVRTVPAKVIAHLDGYTAPRLVEYFDYDPCEGEVEAMMEPEVAAGKAAKPSRREGARSLGVKIEREFAVGSYDIQMLSAKQSDGLVTYLKSEGYKMPEGAEAALAGYIKMGMKFFVARVNLSRHSAQKVQELEPLQLRFRSKNFMLPLQLGKVNGNGPQDLIVMTLTRKGAVELANYPLTKIPTDVDVPVFVKDVFPSFYRNMFNKLAPKSGAFLEYAWDMSWCDPCADDPLSYEEFQQLGVGWVSKAQAQTPNVFVTRMHVRYDKSSFGQDLMFRETASRDNFQGRYVMNHPFDGPIACPEGKSYVAETRKRLKAEAVQLRALTGWKASDIAKRIAKTTQARYQ